MSRRLILPAAACFFGVIWIRRMVEWWGDPAAMIAFSIVPAFGFLAVYVITREPRPPERLPRWPEMIRQRSPLVDISLAASLLAVTYFSPEAAVFYGLVLSVASAYWVGYCQGRVHAQLSQSSPERNQP
jgi:hypothetical protein